jgi:hypothetical protein
MTETVITAPETLETKKPWESRTLLVSALIGIATAISALVPQAQVVSDYINSHGTQIAIGWSLLATILRLVTKDKVSLRD